MSFFTSQAIQDDLGFNDILALLSSMAKTAYGKEALATDVFPNEVVFAERCNTSAEAQALVARLVAPDFGALKEIRHILQAVDKDTVLAGQDIVEVAKTIDAIGRVKDVIAFQKDDATHLGERAHHLHDERRFSRRVLRSFDEQCALLDDASPELASRRARVHALRADAHVQLEGLVRQLSDDGLLRDRNFTIRSDRYVLPVKSEFQGRVDGIVHDASQTHQTVFIEPKAMLQLGNRIKIAHAEVVEEEQRIFREMSAEIGELSQALAHDVRIVGALEAAFARGQFGHLVDGRVVAVDGDVLSLENARHPLLAYDRSVALLDGKPARAVVGNDIRFGNARGLVISGPNAGGKTVALKTAGVLSLMAHAGIPIPVDGNSRMPRWRGVLVSIGDEQSLSGALSSFSGHLTQIQAMLQTVDVLSKEGPVLCLLDELMAGTDPQQGAALGQATLEHLVQHGAFVVVTTHYDRLKALGILAREDRNARFRNASVGVDAASGRPTFRLQLDQVGTSNAFDAARRFGIPSDVIVRAEALLAPEAKELHGLIRALAGEQQQLEARARDAEAQRAELLERSRMLEQKLVEVDAERSRLRREGKRAFLSEIATAQEAVARAIAATQSERRDARSLNEVSQELHRVDGELRKDAGPLVIDNPLLRPATIKVGDVVELASMPGVRFDVLLVHDDDIEVGKGAMRMRATKDMVRAPSEKSAEKSAGKMRKVKATAVAAPSTSSPRTTSNSLDVRGQRVEDALEMLDAFIDRLVRDGERMGFVLHGHGTGVLKKVIRQTLSGHKAVVRAAAADHDDGGDAWTALAL
jgi:DNA mismatch repair protein MutS2